MQKDTMNLTQLSEWQKLLAHFAATKSLHLRELFMNDPGRGERYSL